jgi:hypothetical protein
MGYTAVWALFSKSSLLKKTLEERGLYLFGIFTELRRGEVRVGLWVGLVPVPKNVVTR